MSNLRLKGVAGNIPFNCPAEYPYCLTHMTLKEVHSNADGKIEAIDYYADCGHCFGELNETKVITIRIGEKVSFSHQYVDTGDGTWVDGGFKVIAELVEG